MSSAPVLPVFDFAQVLSFGFHFPARMSVLPLGNGELALVSPVPIDDARAREIEDLGRVRYLVAPNLLHHLYLADAARRYPDAEVLAPPGLAQKRPDLRIHHSLDADLPAALAAAVDVVRVEGAPAVDEFAFFHRATETLVVTDLVFNVVRPEGLTANVVLALVGCRGRLASSRAWRLLFVKDRQRARESFERLLALPARALVMAHGEVIRDDARARLAAALSWLVGESPRLPAQGGDRAADPSP